MKLILGSRRCAEFLLVCVLSGSFAANAEESAPEDGSETTTSEESLDKVEIVKEPNAEDEGLFGISKTELKLWQFQAFYDRINLSLELSGNSLGDKKLEYFTETEFVVGVGVRRGPYGLSFSRTMKNTNDSDRTSGRTSLASYRFDWKLDKHHIEAFHYSFEGFSIREPDKKILNAAFNKDVLAHSAGVFYTYLFEPEDVVLPGVLDRKKPTEGGTSFIFSSQISSFNIESKDPLVPEEYRVGSVPHADARKLARFRAYGGPGFGFFIPWEERIDISGSVGMSMGLSLERNVASANWNPNLGVSLPVQLGLRFSEAPIEAGIYGIFDIEGVKRARKGDLNFGWRQDMIETYIAWKF